MTAGFISVYIPDATAPGAGRGFVQIAFSTGPEKGAPFPAALQYRVDAWSEWGKPLVRPLLPKIRLICCPRIEDVSDIKLIRTDTTLDLSQKAEKR